MVHHKFLQMTIADSRFMSNELVTTGPVSRYMSNTCTGNIHNRVLSFHCVTWSRQCVTELSPFYSCLRPILVLKNGAFQVLIHTTVPPINRSESRNERTNRALHGPQHPEPQSVPAMLVHQRRPTPKNAPYIRNSGRSRPPPKPQRFAFPPPGSKTKLPPPWNKRLNPPPLPTLSVSSMAFRTSSLHARTPLELFPRTALWLPIRAAIEPYDPAGRLAILGAILGNKPPGALPGIAAHIPNPIPPPAPPGIANPP